VTRLDAKNALAHFGIGRILDQNGDRAGALASYREALRLKADLWAVYPPLARLDPGAVEGLDQRAGVSPGARNNVAWSLATASEGPPKPRSVALAVRLARAAVQAAPREGTYRNTLGVVLDRAGDWTGAIAELEEAIRRMGDNQEYSFNGFFLAMAHWRLGDQSKALAYYDRSVHWMEGFAPSNPELSRFRAEAEALLDTSRPRPDFRTVLGDIAARGYYGIGMAAGARGDWAAARADLRRVVEGTAAPGASATPTQGTPDSAAWLFLAVLELEQGDPEAYRAHCRRMLDRFRMSTDPFELERAAKAGLLVPTPSPEEAARLRAIARAAVERAGTDNPGLYWLLLAHGLAEYRAGDADAALKALDLCLERAPDAIVKIPALAIQAMALQRQGRSQEAQDRLARAERLIAELLTPFGQADWPDRLIGRRLAGEAEAVVRFDPVFPANPFAP
jgi:tetratricopeptide (TPR) repeat protein